ncbi:uncharacterized protein LOC109542834 [Dendroctonus ponderosae]|uniref:XLF-like N-terminal domain-containing protein n=1 Tax=Dendroctonus ponderosae TaxID=77166 RepID=A0AAR5Q3L7_DENPD|nr:uncharacterized protein LOC109542834 [Dendroctonus ponderosae]KAH1012895.1 hypothetical protein HUJ05_011972 [Dendroctonus ponderosae]KAH1012896.1 hypothetical protein HUJ05_011972 [Dendroctonus ponderosae]
MWKVFSYEGKLFMLSVTKTDGGCDIILSDLVFIWKNHISTSDLLAEYQRNGCSINSDIDIRNILLETVNNLQEVNASVKHILSTDVELILEKSSVQKDSELEQNIVNKFTLIKRDQEIFRNTIAIPMIQTLNYLEQQNKVLLSLIQKKDRELEEFRMEKGDISRDELKTEPFDPKSLDANTKNLFLTVFSDESSKSLLKNLAETNGEIQANKLEVETQPWNNVKRKKVVRDGKTVAKKGAGIIFKGSK